MCKRDCTYLGTMNLRDGAGGHCCNYSLICGKTRTAQLCKKYGLKPNHKVIKALLRGENCPFFEETPKRRTIPEHVRPRIPGRPAHGEGYQPPENPEEKTQRFRLDTDKVTELYKLGLTDQEIGNIVGATNSAIWNWRKKHDLPCNGKRGGDSAAKRKYDREKIRRMSEQGATVKEIAHRLNCSTDTIHRIAREEGFALNQKKPEEEAECHG